MKWTPGRRSENLEDRRGASGEGGGAGGGGGFGFGTGGGGGRGMGGGKMGLGGIVMLLILSVVFKQDFLGLAGGGGGGAGAGEAPAAGEQAAPLQDAREEPLVQFVSFVLDDSQALWRKLLPQMGAEYRDAKLVLFREATETA